MTREHVHRAVKPALRPFADVVQERRGNEVGVGVASFDEPTGSLGAVDDVAWVLSLEQRHQRLRQPVPREGEVGLHRMAARVAELAEAIGDHVKSSSVPVARPPISHQIGLTGVTKPITSNAIKIPMP